MKLSLRQALQTTWLTGDGAMGTFLHQQGFPVNVSYEEFNVLRPELVEGVHRLYYEAGARIIETNTFSANYENMYKYGLESEVEPLTAQACGLPAHLSAATLMSSGQSARSVQGKSAISACPK